MKRLQVVLVPVLVLALVVGPGLATQAGTAPSDVTQNDAAGPPSDLPGPVPDFVGEILGSIQEFIDDVLEGDLGGTVSETAGSETTDDG